MRQFDHSDRDQELFNILSNPSFQSITYDLSPTHTILIYPESSNRLYLREIIGELDTFDMNNLQTLADFRRFTAFQQAKPKLTPGEINSYFRQSILSHLFFPNLHIHSGYNPGSRNMVYDITLSTFDPDVLRPPYTQTGNVEKMLQRILEEIYKRGEPKIKIEYIKWINAISHWNIYTT